MSSPTNNEAESLHRSPRYANRILPPNEKKKGKKVWWAPLPTEAIHTDFKLIEQVSPSLHFVHICREIEKALPLHSPWKGNLADRLVSLARSSTLSYAEKMSQAGALLWLVVNRIPLELPLPCFIELMVKELVNRMDQLDHAHTKGCPSQTFAALVPSTSHRELVSILSEIVILDSGKVSPAASDLLLSLLSYPQLAKRLLPRYRQQLIDLAHRLDSKGPLVLELESQIIPHSDGKTALNLTLQQSLKNWPRTVELQRCYLQALMSDLSLIRSFNSQILSQMHFLCVQEPDWICAHWKRWIIDGGIECGELFFPIAQPIDLPEEVLNGIVDSESIFQTPFMKTILNALEIQAPMKVQKRLRFGELMRQLSPNGDIKAYLHAHSNPPLLHVLGSLLGFFHLNYGELSNDPMEYNRVEWIEWLMTLFEGYDPSFLQTFKQVLCQKLWFYPQDRGCGLVLLNHDSFLSLRTITSVQQALSTLAIPKMMILSERKRVAFQDYLQSNLLRSSLADYIAIKTGCEVHKVYTENRFWMPGKRGNGLSLFAQQFSLPISHFSIKSTSPLTLLHELNKSLQTHNKQMLLIQVKGGDGLHVFTSCQSTIAVFARSPSSFSKWLHDCVLVPQSKQLSAPFPKGRLATILAELKISKWEDAPASVRDTLSRLASVLPTKDWSLATELIDQELSKIETGYSPHPEYPWVLAERLLPQFPGHTWQSLTRELAENGGSPVPIFIGEALYQNGSERSHQALICKWHYIDGEFAFYLIDGERIQPVNFKHFQDLVIYHL